MPGKPKRKGKHPLSKKGKAIVRQGTTAPYPMTTDTAPTQASPTPAAPEPVAERPSIVRPVARVKTAAYVAASAEHYPFFVGELKRIGLLAGIIIVVLVVLSIALS